MYGLIGMKVSRHGNSDIFNLVIVLVAFVNLGVVVARNFSDDSTIRILQMAVPSLLVLIAVVVAIKFSAYVDDDSDSKPWIGLSFISLAVLVSSITYTQTYVPMPNEFWEGFGPLGAATVIVLSGLVFSLRLTHKLRNYALAKLIFRVVIITLCALYLLNLVQPNNGFLNINDQTYIVLDEFLAPLSGWTPNSDYLPTYTGLLGYLFYPLTFFDVGPEATMNLIVLFANIATVSVLFIVSALLRTFLPTVVRTTLLLATLALVSVTARQNQSVSVFHNFGWFGRHLIPILAIYILTLGLKRRKGQTHLILILSSATLSAIAVLNNPDYGLLFGVAVVFSLALLTLLLPPYRQTWLIFLGGFVAAMFTYLLVLSLSNNPWRLDYYLALVSQATEGDVYAFSALDVLGPHLLVLGVFCATLCFALMKLLRFRKSVPSNLESLDVALISCAIVSSTWSILTMQKFFTSPHTIGVSYYFVNAVLCGGLLLAMMRYPQSLTSPLGGRRNLAILFPIVAISILPFASILHAANPYDELKRVSGRAQSFNWSFNPLRPPADSWNPSDLRQRGTLHFPTRWLSSIEDLFRTGEYKKSEFGYFGYMGNTVQLITGVKNLTATSAPELFRFGQFFLDAGCSTITSQDLLEEINFVIVFGLNRDPSVTPDVCAGLTLRERDNSGLLALYEIDFSTDSK